MNYTQQLATQLGLRPEQVAATIELFDAGNTVPFIARYRKERTGGLDEEQLRQLNALLTHLRALDERRQTIVASIEAQGKLTPELHELLLAAETRTALEDLYRPYKPRRRTRASVAREKGLQALADAILRQEPTTRSVAHIAEPFLSPDVPTVEAALAGARDIAAQTISDHPEVRQLAREKALRRGVLRSSKASKAEDPRHTYEVYYDFECRVNRLRPHQILAINRGEAEKALRVQVEIPEQDWQSAIRAHFRPDQDAPLAEQLRQAANDAAHRLLLPAIERDVRRSLTERAEAHAIAIFAANLRALLSQPPLIGRPIMGIDPGFRTGCKVAVVDHTGRVMDTTTVYPHAPQRKWDTALERLQALVVQHKIRLVAIGNGTASRETERLVAELIHEQNSKPQPPNSNVPTPSREFRVSDTRHDLRYMIVSEAGASVYSASPLARAELPDLDVSMRGAVSIARRVQDPLAELVKIDPRSIGVGMYQHDVDQTALAKALTDVVESLVNHVGVDVNTASPALLTHVSGVGPKLAERIVAYRDANGPFPNRMALRDVPGLGPKTFEQAAGFLRIRDVDNRLDASAIHPESYTVAEAVLARAGLTMQTEPAEREAALVALQEQQSLNALATELGTGAPTLADILEQLIRPGRDPREDLPAPILRSDVLTMDDLRQGMRLKGTVRNVVDFGAFVDIGVKHDGLLHRSQIPSGTRLKVGDVIDVEILRLEPKRGRIGLGWPGAGPKRAH